jgi:hypothetical protein
MSQSPKKPTASENDRRERQAEALRENLRRRKEQARSRESPDGGSPSRDSSSPGSNKDPNQDPDQAG